MPNLQYIQQAKKVKIYYDPRGQVVKTVNPDGSQQQVLFGVPNNITAPPATILERGKHQPTPWESYTYDANDLAPRSHPGQTATDTGVNPSHHFTPKSTVLDPLGRTIKTIDRNGSQEADQVVMKYSYDIRGNLLKVTDALDRTAFTHVYDLKPKAGEEDKGANILKTTHIDSGTKTALFDASFKPIELKDAKGALILHGYDELNRPTRIWAKDNSGEDVTLRQKLVYGDDATDGPVTPENTNHLGKLYEHYDEAGLVTVEEYDFKGNVLQKKREVIADSDILAVFTGPPTDWEVPTYRVDWEGTPTLEGEYATDMDYDALNRLKKLVYPEDVDIERKELVPTYNRAGALEKVSLGGNPYVEHIAYNAKGQRLLIAFGNAVMTRYAYDPLTFRLKRQRSETFTRTGWQFVGAGTVHQDTGYDYDLSGNILRIQERVTDCGVGGTDTLDREFSYDPLYRLLSASGRENSPTITPIWDDSYRSTDHSITTSYTQNYQYDRMGNILQLRHSGNNNFTRVFNPTGGGTPPNDYGSSNLLNEIKVGGTNYDFTYDPNGNQIQENTDRHYEWDSTDKLRSFRLQAGISQPTKFAHYLYDTGGNRVKKLMRVSGGSYTSTTNIDGIFEYITDGTDTQNTLHVMDDKSRIATVRLGDDLGDATPPMKYVLEDHLGNSTFEINGDGTFIAKEEYYPFGETSFASYAKKRYKYNGKERDEESGLYNYGMRYYSAWTCRFMSVDPLFREYAYYTPYQYAGNKPINFIDLDGLEEAVRDTKVITVPDATMVDMPPLPNLDNNTITGGEAASLADNVYGGLSVANPKGGFVKAEGKMAELMEKGVVFEDPSTGLKSALYERTNLDGSTEYAHVFAGSEPFDMKDWKEDANQALGRNAPQYEQAVRNSQIISDALKGSDLTFVGHSLGGGLASAAALATGRNAITFNASGLHPNTKADNDLNMRAKIDAYVVQGEIVNYGQHAVKLKPEGKVHELKTNYLGNGAYSVYQRVNNHKMSTVMDKMKQQGIR